MAKDFDRLTLQMPCSHPLQLRQAMKTSLQLIANHPLYMYLNDILANNIFILSDSLSQRTYIDTTIQPMIIPKLICDVVKDEIDDADKALSILSVQHALERLLTNPSFIRLHYILILCSKLYNKCEELHRLDQLLIASLKMKLRVSSLIHH